MDKEKREKVQKNLPEDDSISRRKFFKKMKKMAYTAPVVMTFIASEAHAARPTPCQPSHCKPAPCRPSQPPPCMPYRSYQR